MSGLRAQIKEVLKENSSKQENFAGKYHRAKFDEAITRHLRAFERGDHEDAQDYLKIAQLHAKMHYRKTKKKIDVGDGLDGFESKYVTHGD
jgi:hypothetical protein